MIEQSAMETDSYPKFHNEAGAPIVRIGWREFKCIAQCRHKIIRTSILTWVMPMRSFAPIARRYSASILVWAHAKQSQRLAATVMPISRLGRHKYKP
jgi:hypothetical protein